MIDLHHLAAALGVRVEVVPLHGVNGLYDDDARVIYLDRCLTSWQERSTLAHEVSHARWRDRDSRPSYEARADAEAARTLISVDEYAAAEDEVGPDPGALAERLGVCRWVIETWQRAAWVGRNWTRPSTLATKEC